MATAKRNHLSVCLEHHARVSTEGLVELSREGVAIIERRLDVGLRSLLLLLVAVLELVGC